MLIRFVQSTVRYSSFSLFDVIVHFEHVIAPSFTFGGIIPHSFAILIKCSMVDMCGVIDSAVLA